MKDLPQRPRLRVTFWYEGELARCELVLMDERRDLVHRETLPIEPGSSLERVHSGLLSAAGGLARARDQAISQPEEVPSAAADPSEPVPAPPEPPARVPREPPSPEQLEQLAAERHRRAEQQASEQEQKLELEQQSQEATAPEATALLLLSADELAEERQRRISLQGRATLIENEQPDPTAKS